MFKAKTVESVFNKFTKGLKEVVAANRAVAKDAFDEQIRLKADLTIQADLENAANVETVRAQKAVINIGALLGISMDDTKSTDTK